MNRKRAFGVGRLLLRTVMCLVFVLSSMKITKNLASALCSNPCTDSGCIHLVEDIVSKMDPTVDPCQDFYSFACGSFMDDRIAMRSAEDETFRILKDLLEKSNAQPGSDIDKFKTVYETCMNPVASEMRAFKDIVKLLEDVGLKNWPNFNATFARESSWKVLSNILGKMITHYERLFFNVYVERTPDANSSAEQKLKVFTFSTGWTRYPEEKDIGLIQDLINRILSNNGVDDQRAVEIWNDFLSVCRDDVVRKNRTYDGHPDISVSCNSTEDQSMIFFCDIAKTAISYSNVSESVSDKFVLISSLDRQYFNQFLEILEKYSDRTIANYIAVKVLYNRLKYISPEYRRFLYHRRSRSDRSAFRMNRKEKFCLAVLSGFPGPLETLYLSRGVSENYFSDEVHKMLDEIVDAQLENVNNASWIDNEIKRKFSEDHRLLKPDIKILRYSHVTEDQYTSFVPSNESFLQNMFDLEKEYFVKRLGNLFYRPAPFEYAAWSALGVYLTLGILRPPVYSPEYPMVFNLARLGFVIGHELGHEVVHLLQKHRSYNETFRVFTEKEECFIKKYSKYELEHTKKKVNGRDTIMDNLSDVFGVMILEQIASKYLPSMKEENFSLPSLNYTLEQLMYISNAQIWCMKSNKDTDEYYFNDFHSPPQFRVLGPLSISRKFAQAFDCPFPAPMNPREKCSFFE